jgi:hypothetical protein
VIYFNLVKHFIGLHSSFLLISRKSTNFFENSTTCGFFERMFQNSESFVMPRYLHCDANVKEFVLDGGKDKVKIFEVHIKRFNLMFDLYLSMF